VKTPRTFFFPLLELAAAIAFASFDFCSLGACRQSRDVSKKHYRTPPEAFAVLHRTRRPRRPALIPPEDIEAHQTKRTILNIIDLNIYQATEGWWQDGLNGTGGQVLRRRT
jgi:ABC-type molybdenum transport system ATPase subunit/photorepair protein PhrA